MWHLQKKLTREAPLCSNEQTPEKHFVVSIFSNKNYKFSHIQMLQQWFASSDLGSDVGREAVGRKRRRKRGWGDPGPAPSSIGVPRTAWWCLSVPPLKHLYSSNLYSLSGWAASGGGHGCGSSWEKTGGFGVLPTKDSGEGIWEL